MHKRFLFCRNCLMIRVIHVRGKSLRQSCTKLLLRWKMMSPGIDGLTMNFYKHFWPLLGNKLTLVYNYAFRSGQVSVSQRRGVISLLFKKGDRTLLKNWRPITLLTTDYKILTKALANRLQQVISLIVHTDQTASIKGRMRLLHDAITCANDNNIPLAPISVDQPLIASHMKWLGYQNGAQNVAK